MMAAPSLRSAGRLARHLFAWWKAELWAMVPERLRRRLQPVPAAMLVDASGSGLVIALRRQGVEKTVATIGPEGEAGSGMPEDQADAVERLIRDKVPVHLCIDGQGFLRRALTLPLDVEPTLRRALEFQVDSLTPFKREDVHVGYRIDRRDFLKNELHVAVAVVPRERVEPALDRARRHGVAPDAIEAAGADAPIVVPLNAGTIAETATARRPGGLSLALACLALLLLGAAVYIPIYRLEQRAEVLKAAIEQARENAQATQRLRDKLATTREAGRFFAERKVPGALMIDVIDEVTRRVPDGAWLTELRADGTALFLSGFASSASSLLGEIEASDMLSDTKFLSPVTREGKDNVERFEISAVARKTAP